MSFLSRIGNIGHALYGAVEAPVGLALDLGKAPFVDEKDFDGFVHTLWGRTVERGSNMISELLGPQGVGGQVAGAIPEPVRHPLAIPINGTLEGLNWTYREGIGEPLSTLMTMGSFADSKTQGQGWGAFLNPDAWSDAYAIAQHRSPGQAVALAFGTKDILDQKQVNKFMGSDAYHMVSGITDGLIHWYDDPGRILGEGLRESKIASEGHFTVHADVRQLALKAGMSEEQAANMAAQTLRGKVLTYLGSDHWDAVKSRMTEINNRFSSVDDRAAAIRDRFFKDHPNGVDLSHIFAHANDPAEMDYAMRIATGEFTAVDELHRTNPQLAAELGSKMEDRAVIRNSNFDPSYHQSPTYRGADPLTDMNARINGIHEALGTTDRLENAIGTIDRRMKAGPVSDFAYKLRTNDFLQHSAWTKPVRVFYNMRPHGMVNAADPMVDTQVDRMLREAGMDDATRGNWRGKVINATEAERPQIILDAEDAGVRQLAVKHGWSDDHVAELLTGRAEYRKAAENLLKNAEADEKGRAWVNINGPDEMARVPVGQMADIPMTIPLVNMRMLDREMGFWPQTLEKLGLKKTAAIPGDLVDRAMRVWRPATLLRPAWPLRVVGDESLRMLAAADALAGGSARLREIYGDYATFRGGAKNYLRNASQSVPLTWGGTTGALFGGLVAGPLGALVGAPGGVGLQLFMRSIDEVPYAQMLINGHLVHGAFGNPDDIATVQGELAKAHGSYQEAVGRKLQFEPPKEGLTTFIPGKKGYGEAWEEAITKIRDDELYRAAIWFHSDVSLGAEHLPRGINDWLDREYTKRIQQGVSDPNIPTAEMERPTLGDWLKDSPEGQAYMAKHHITDPHDLYAQVEDHVKNLIPAAEGDANLARKILGDGEFSYQDLLDQLTPKTPYSEDIVKRYLDEHYPPLPAEPVNLDLSASEEQWFRDNHYNTEEIARQQQEIRDMWEGNAAIMSPDSQTRNGLPHVGDTSELGELWRTWHQNGNHFVVDENGQFVANEWVHHDDIPVNKIVTWQDTVDRNQVGDYIRNLDGAGPSQNERVLVMKVGDNYALMDGNHRTNAALARGDRTVPAAVLTPDEVPDALVRHVQQTLDNFPGRPKISKEAMTPNLDGMPAIHHEAIDQTLPNSPTKLYAKGVVDRLYHVLGELPTDDLTRQPYFARLYSMDMERKLSGLPAGSINDATLRAMEDASRNVALQGVRHLLYDFAEKSEFAEMVRNIIPFYPAWQEVLTRWAGLAYENPAFINKARLIAEAPGKMGAEWKDPTTGDTYIRFRLPGFAKALVGHGFLKGALDDQGYVKFNKQGFNMASGLPGFGPFVDVALQPFVTAHPELIDSLKIVYPFGSPPASVMDAFLPPNVQRVRGITDDDARSYRSAYNRILITRVTKMQTGELPKLNLDDPQTRDQFLNDVAAEAKSFSALRLVAGMLSPAAPSFDTPYQPLLEAYRKLQDADPATAADKFLDQYGDDYFALTQAFTKINNGIPPSIQGHEAQQKYADLIQAYPDLGSLIIGTEGGGSATKFSAAVYQKQLQDPLSPGSRLKQRTPLSPDELLDNSDARLGWTKFTRAMDIIDAVQNERGFANLQVKGAEPLRIAKDAIIAKLAQDHPGWFQDYSVRDEQKWNNRIEAMNKIVADERLSQRPDIQGLTSYLRLRDGILGVLAARPQHGITAQSNRDVAAAWEAIVSKLKNSENGLAFSDLYNRWLQNDPLAAPTVGGFPIG